MSIVGFLALLLLLLLLRQNLVLILLAMTGYVHLVWGAGRLTYLIDDLWTSLDSEVLLAIPLFIAAGNIMTRGMITERIVDILRLGTQPLPGGLGVATIMSCALFAAISGSSPVTLLAIGSILYPALIREGYSKKYALGALTSAGTLGIIIPPSIPLILYGIVTETSIAELFLAGVLPGLLIAALMSGYSLWANRAIPSKPWQGREFLRAVRKGIWALSLPVILLGGIYSGYYSATEAAAVAVGYGLLVEIVIYRRMKLREFLDTSVATAKMLGVLFPIVAVALSIKTLLTLEQVPQSITLWVTSVVSDKVTFLLAVNLLLLIVGCFIDIVSALLVLAPLLLAVARAYGIDPVHFGLIMVVNLEIGFLTPPVGLNLVVAMTAFKEPFLLICRSVLPFIVLMLGALAIVTFVPGVSLLLVR